MSSSFGWIDFAEEDRRRMTDVVSLFREQDTRDELGLGTVRDAFSNLFFPGITTIQTRAKYMLLVPWIYRRRERLRTPSKDVARLARRDELTLIRALLDSEDTEGVIGKEARNKLQRLPSSIYWSGLETWGIRLFGGSQAQYHRSLDAFHRRRREHGQQARQEKGHADIRIDENWDPGLPKVPQGFPHEASLSLTGKQSDYLQHRIMTNCGHSLLAFLVDETSPNQGVDFAWQHPGLARFPRWLRDQVQHAQNFSEVMHGAMLLYNLMLAEETGWEQDIAKYRDRLNEWWEKTVFPRRAELSRWNLNKFWQVAVSADAKIPWRTRQFVESWIGFVLESDGDLVGLLKNENARNLIYDREVALKRSRARLKSQRALELWGGESGTAPLDYRWDVGSTIVDDILKGSHKDA